jgi:hypothetical protein
VFTAGKLNESLLLLQLSSFLLVLQEVDSLVVHLFVLLSDFLLAIEQSLLFVFWKLDEESGSPLHIEDVLLKGVLGDDFSDEVPDLVTLLCAEEDESAGLIDVEEVHAADNEVLLGEFEVEHTLSLLFVLTSDHTQ